MPIWVKPRGFDPIPKCYHSNIFRYPQERCKKCNRGRLIHGNINGLCMRCMTWRVRSDIDNVLRCTEQQGEFRLQCTGERTCALPQSCRTRVLDYLAYRPSSLQDSVNQTVWKSILLGYCPGMGVRVPQHCLVSQERIAWFRRMVERPETPLMWKLQLSWIPTYSSGGSPNDNLIHYLLSFLEGCGPRQAAT